MRASIICVTAAALLLALPGLAGVSGPQLADAAEAADWPLVRSMLGRATDANRSQEDGTTALHWAARHDELEVARLLVAAGARPDSSNRYGVRPLSLACTNGSTAMVELLLEAGANPNTTLPGGETALMTAARTGRLGPVKALLRGGASPRATVRGMGRQDGAGANAFLRRMRDPSVFDFRPNSDQTALIWAVAEGHAEVMKELIEFGADFHARLESGFTPLLLAARAGHLDAARVLIAAGADVNQRIAPSPEWRHLGFGAKLRPGATALHVAVENGNYELAAELLAAGADPNAADPGGYTALHAVPGARRVPPGDANPPPDTTGSMTSLEFVREIAARGANLNARMTGPGLINLGVRVLGPTPFLSAAQTADVELMRTLVELGADPLLTDNLKRNALMLAGARAGTGRDVLRAMEMLLDLGIDIDALDDNGETAMHSAAYRDRPEPIKFLASRGASVEVWNRENVHGSTPLALAAGYQGARRVRPHPKAEAAIREAMAVAGIVPPPELAVRSPVPSDAPRTY